MYKIFTIFIFIFFSQISFATDETLTLSCKHIKTDFFDFENNIEETKRNLEPKSIILDLEKKTANTTQGKKTFKDRGVEVWWQYKNEVPATDDFKAVNFYWNHTLDRVSGSYVIEEAFCIEGQSQCAKQDNEYYSCSKQEELF
tara:strand:+ start:239 stop:667 length:429 start_codon:yes stop_codon:yes gene_type:complete